MPLTPFMNSFRKRKRFRSFGQKATLGTQNSTKIMRVDAGMARRSSTETRSDPASSIAASRSEKRRRAATGTERKTRTKDGPKRETKTETRTERGSGPERKIPTERESGTNGGTRRERESATRMEKRRRRQGGKVERMLAVRFVNPTATLFLPRNGSFNTVCLCV